MNTTVSTAASSAPFSFKSAALNLIAFTPNTADLSLLETAMQQRLGGNADFFGGEWAIINLTMWPESATALDLSSLLALLRRYGLVPIAVRSVQASVTHIAKQMGLALLPDAASLPGIESQPPVPAKQSSAPVPITQVPIVPKAKIPANTLIIDKPVRSGQRIYAQDADLVVLGVVSAAAEVMADGNIHVYAPLRGRALAGANGNNQARIFTYCMEAELLSIAGVYRNIEEPLPKSIKGRAAQVRLDGNKLITEMLTLG